jgi:5'-nucleotidase (lipoprotein e(P4) family)
LPFLVGCHQTVTYAARVIFESPDMRNFVIAASLCVVALSVQPAAAAPLTYDCQARLARVEIAPPVAAGDTNPWQCPVPTVSKQITATHWVRNSLEYCRMAVNVYDEALAAARRMAKMHKRGQWIVTLDADETVLDNSLFERERNACGDVYNDAIWRNWVAANLATGVPGAAAFTQAVHRLGGLVAIVTNRDADQDALTQVVLKNAGIWFDYEIGRTNKVDDKTTRWQGALAALKAKAGGRPLGVIWLGDQVTDFPILDKTGAIVRAMSQKDSGDGIGTYLFLLPNPMYGNWQKNPPR